MKLRLLSISLILLVAILPTSPLLADRVVLSGADFHTVNGGGQFFEVADGSIVGHGGLGGTCLVAGVDLPDGAIFTNMRVRYLDNAGTDFSLDLLRKRRGNSVSAASVAHVDSFGVSASIQETNAIWDITSPVDTNYTYYLSSRWDCLDSALHRIYAVTIDYDAPIFVDGFESGGTAAWGVTPSKSRTKFVSGVQFRAGMDGPSDPGGYWWLINPDLGTFEQPDVSDYYLDFCATAPVELPDGVTLQGFIANAYDGRNDRGLTLNLHGKRMNLIGSSVVLAAASTSPSTGWKLLTDLSASTVINNSQYWYYLDVCVTGGTGINIGDLQTQAVQIFYTLP